MNLLACFKIVPDMEAIDSTDWEVDDSLSVDLSYVRPIWNCFDESSLEMLLKLSDLSEGFCSLVNLWALTVGKKNADSYLSTLYALGYERAIRIKERKKRTALLAGLDGGSDCSVCEKGLRGGRSSHGKCKL